MSDTDDNLPELGGRSLDADDYANQRNVGDGGWVDGGDERSGESIGTSPADEIAALKQQVALLELMVRRLVEQMPQRAVAATAGATPVVVKVTGNASGGGKYNGRVLTGTPTTTASGNLSMPEGMTVPGSDDALVINLIENGASTHAIATNTYHHGVNLGTVSSLKIVAILGFSYAC